MKHLISVLLTIGVFFGGVFAYTPVQQDYDLINSFESRLYSMSDAQLGALIDKLDYFLDEFQQYERVVFVLEHISASAQQILYTDYADGGSNDIFGNLFDESSDYIIDTDLDLYLAEPFVNYDISSNNLVAYICGEGHDVAVRATLLFIIEGKEYNKSIILPYDGSDIECKQYSFSLSQFSLKAGPHYRVELVIDPYNYLQETNEDNNYISTAMSLPNYINNYPLADLVVDSIGSMHNQVQVNVSNIGAGEHNQVDVYLYTRDKSYHQTISLGEQEGKAVYFDDVSYDNMYFDTTLTAVIDPFDNIQESDETNNKKADTVNVEDQFDFYVKQSSYAALTETINMTICNAYNFLQNSQYVVDIKVSAGGKSVKRSLVLPQTNYSGLSKCVDTQVSLGSFGIVTPNFSYSVIVDPEDLYEESDEANNIIEKNQTLY